MDNNTNLKAEETLKEFKIPVNWQVCGEVIIKAKDMESALETAINIEKFEEGLQLPTESQYIDGSFEIEQDMLLIEELNKDIL